MFRHELCHFLSRDLWIKVGFQVIGCVLWWNPVMPLLKRNVEQLLELRCDQKVCRRLSAEKQLSYMETLSVLMKLGSTGVAQVYMGYLGQDMASIWFSVFGCCSWGNQARVSDADKSSVTFFVPRCLLLLIALFCNHGTIPQNLMIMEETYLN